MGFLNKPLAVFNNLTDKGINELPNESYVQITEYDGVPLLIYVLDTSSYDSNTTVNDLLSDTNNE